MTKKTIKLWMDTATTKEQQELAEGAETSRNYLYRLSQGQREPSPQLAKRIEKKTLAMNKRTRGRLPVLWRVDTVPACSQCEFARECMASRAALEIKPE